MRKRLIMGAIFAAVAVLAVGCGGAEDGGAEGEEQLSGTILIDGSSTVFPISEAVAEEFRKESSRVKVTVGQSGSGGGFKKFCNGETDISDASRAIKPQETAACAAKGIEYTELKIATDGLSIVVNKQNSFAKCLTIDQLKKIWEPASTVKTWKDVDGAWPANAMKLYGPGADSGTFDYFTEEVVGEAKKSRSDYTASEDDNVLVQGVAGDASSLGYFGYAYLVENKGKIKAVAVDGGSGCVEPTKKTIEDGAYTPLSRPLYIYVRNAALQRPEVKAFAEYYMKNVSALVPDVGYIALPADDMKTSRDALDKAIEG